MKTITKMVLTIVLAAFAAGILIWYFWPKNQNSAPSSAKIVETATAMSSDPYNITNVKSDDQITLDIIAAKMTLAGQNLTRYLYTDASKTAYPAGMPLVIDEGKPVTIKVNNQSGTPTNVHWHGLTVPNDQDGPSLTINSGESHTYQFTPTESGTYWAHSHDRPVESQVGDGMYAPLIVRGPNDAKYDLDEIVLLSDLTTGGSGMMASGTSIDTVNGKATMNTLTVKAGSYAQLRFINAAPDNAKTLNFPFDVTVTHRDGYALSKPEIVRSLTLYPGQRADVEINNFSQVDENKMMSITDGTATIPIKFTGMLKPLDDMSSTIYTPAKASPISPELLTKSPDFTIALAAGSDGGMMSGSGMAWSMNGKIYPDTGTMKVKVGQTYKIEFTNSNTGMMAIDHPIHIHGAYFQVISIDGQATNDDSYYDTYPMKAGSRTDIAIKFDLPGV